MRLPTPATLTSGNSAAGPRFWPTMKLWNSGSPIHFVEEFDSPGGETSGVGGWLGDCVKDRQMQPHEIGVFVRSAAQLERAREAVAQSGMKAKILDEKVDVSAGSVSVGTMRLAKGLEFRAVAVMACDDEVIPSQERIENAADDSDLEEIYNTERHLLYVACTRARDHLLVSGVRPISEFLDDLGKRDAVAQRAGKQVRP